MAWCRRMQNPKELEDSDSDIENEIQTTLQEDDVEMQDVKQTILNKSKRLLKGEQKNILTRHLFYHSQYII